MLAYVFCVRDDSNFINSYFCSEYNSVICLKCLGDSNINKKCVVMFNVSWFSTIVLFVTLVIWWINILTPQVSSNVRTARVASVDDASLFRCGKIKRLYHIAVNEMKNKRTHTRAYTLTRTSRCPQHVIINTSAITIAGFMSSAIFDPEPSAGDYRATSPLCTSGSTRRDLNDANSPIDSVYFSLCA